jgi:hypothetical protein
MYKIMLLFLELCEGICHGAAVNIFSAFPIVYSCRTQRMLLKIGLAENLAPHFVPDFGKGAVLLP